MPAHQCMHRAFPGRRNGWMPASRGYTGFLVTLPHGRVPAPRSAPDPLFFYYEFVRRGINLVGLRAFEQIERVDLHVDEF